MPSTNYPPSCKERQVFTRETIPRTRQIRLLGRDVTVRNYICSEDDLHYYEKPALPRMQLTICPTSYCSASCPFCIAMRMIRQKDRIDLHKLESLLLELKEQEVIRGISISGGEPATDVVLLKELLEMIYGIFGTGMEVSVNTNGLHLEQVLEIPSIGSLEALHISRHHDDEGRNEQLFGISLPSNAMLSELLHAYPYGNLYVLNCMLMRDYIGTTEDVHRYMDFAIRVGADKTSFITGTPVNEFVRSQAVDYCSIFRPEDPSMLYTRGYYDMEFCCCQDGVYQSGSGELMRFYGRATNAGDCAYTRGLVYGADNRLRCNYDGEILWE